MLRRMVLLVFVVFFVAYEPTFAGRLLARRRAHCPRNAARMKSSCCKTLGPDVFCLQYMIYDDPTSEVYDFYQCDYFPDGCPEPGGQAEHYSDMWYGHPSTALAQSCTDPVKKCEGQARCKDPVHGHGKNLNSQDDAEEELRNGLTVPHGPISFLKIPKFKLTGIVDRDLFVVVARDPRPSSHTPGPSPDGVMYFGLEMEDSGETPTHELKNEDCHHATWSPGGGQLIRIAYHLHGENRVAVIWLK